jgi:fructokinase
VPVRLAARLSEDAFGRRIRSHLAANGVDLSSAVSARERTSLAIVTVTADAGVAYDFRVQDTADWQWTDDELSGVPDAMAALHVGSLAAMLPPGAEAVQRLVERSRARATISYDPNYRPLLMGTREQVSRRVESLIGLADVVKASAEDIASLAPDKTPAEVAVDWLARGPALVAITLGPDGVLAGTRDQVPVVRPGRNVTVADTVGAGDAFVSALLAGLRDRDLLGAERRPELQRLDSQTLVRVLDQAVLATAITCTRRGADPPTLSQLRAAAAD